MTRVRGIQPGWWAAAGGIAAAGATMVPEHRVLAGVSGAVAIMVIAFLASPASGCGCSDCSESAAPNVPTAPPPFVPEARVPRGESIAEQERLMGTFRATAAQSGCRL